VTGHEAAKPQLPVRPAPGVCRFCHCTESNACTLPTGDPCSWFDCERTVCSNPACITAFQALQARQQFLHRQATRKKTPAEIHELIRRRGRKARKHGAA